MICKLDIDSEPFNNDFNCLQDLTEQMSDLQKKADSFEAELMQERLSHVSTRDELETLRKQMDVLKEEIDNEKAGMESRLNTVKAGLEAQLDVKNEVNI